MSKALKILIVYYSRSGNTEKMAQVVAESAKNAGAEVQLKKVQDTSAEDLLAVDAIIVGSPVYYGQMAADIKRLFEDSVKYHGRLDGKVGGAFASSGAIGGGAETTIIGIIQMMFIHGMIVQGTEHYGAVSVGTPTADAISRCRNLGERVTALAKLIGECKPST